MTAASFKHDCINCEYIATVRKDGADFDLIVHRSRLSAGDDTIIARFGNKGEDYSSMPRCLAETLAESNIYQIAIYLDKQLNGGQ